MYQSVVMLFRSVSSHQAGESPSHDFLCHHIADTTRVHAGAVTTVQPLPGTPGIVMATVLSCVRVLFWHLQI